jgi:hypothetical protein
VWQTAPDKQSSPALTLQPYTQLSWLLLLSKLPAAATVHLLLWQLIMPPWA